MSVAEESDEVLVRRTLGGDKTAYDRLVRRHGVRLRRFIQRFVSDQDSVEDIYIEAWGRAYNRLDTFRAEDAQFTTWLFQIARNLARNKFRTEMRHPTVSIGATGRNSEEDGSYTIEIPDSTTDPNETVPEEMQRQEMWEALNAAIAVLPESYREALIWYHLEGRGYDEIAARLGLQEGAVRTRVCRAMERLRKVMRGRFAEIG